MKASTNSVQLLRNYSATHKYLYTEADGINSRLNILQAGVLGLKLPHLVERNCDRNRLAAYYDQALSTSAEYGLYPIKNVSGSGHIYYLYIIRVTADCAVDRSLLHLELSHRNIQTGIHYPIHCRLQPAYQPYSLAVDDTNANKVKICIN